MYQEHLFVYVTIKGTFHCNFLKMENSILIFKKCYENVISECFLNAQNIPFFMF